MSGNSYSNYCDLDSEKEAELTGEHITRSNIFRWCFI